MQFLPTASLIMTFDPGRECLCSSVQCIYAAVTLVVYIGGMAGEWRQLFGKSAPRQPATSRGAKQEAAAVASQQPEAAEREQQVPTPAQTTAVAASQPHADEDESWELLNASAPSACKAEQSLPQEGQGTSLPRAGRGQAIEEETGGDSRSSRDQGMDVHAETGSKSLLYPRSASAAAQLKEGLEPEAPGQDEHSSSSAGLQVSGDRRLEDTRTSSSTRKQPEGARSHAGSDTGQRQQQELGSRKAVGASDEAFIRAEVLWRCTTFTVQVC